MNVRTKRRYGAIFLITGLAFCMSGCSDMKLDYTDEQMDVIANHAAAIVMKHDEKLYTRYLEEEKSTEQETESEPVTEEMTESSGGEETGGNHSSGEPEETTEKEPVMSTSQKLTQAMDINGLTAEYLGCSVTSEYPYENKEDALFVMKANQGTKLLVTKFRLSNQTGQDIQINMMEKNRRYQAVLNDTTKLSVQLTLLLDALNTFEGTVKQGQSVDLVLVYQTKINSETDINHLDIIFTAADGEGTKVRLK